MTLTIHNDRLVVQIQDPGGIYQRSRFDWSGICQQVTLDGKYVFCGQEATLANPGSEGVGLVDEFGINTPIGYDQINVGAWFPKIGVGFLQKHESAAYNFFSEYPIKVAPIQTEQDQAHEIIFLQESEVFGGWGWRLRKTYSLHGSSLTIDYILENCGQKRLTTEQYNHNFIAINGESIGPDYQLETSFPITFSSVDGGIEVDGSNLRLTEVPPTYIYALQQNCAGLEHTAWRLTHLPSGRSLQVREQFPLSKFALWGKSHVISPEFFIWIDLLPGQAQNWQRIYQFS